MSQSSEKRRFESRFSDHVMEVAVVTGPSGIGAGKGGKDILWTASIDLIAWRDLYTNGNVIKKN